MSTFRWRASEEPRYCDVDLLQLEIFRLDDVLRGLKTGRDGLISKDDMSGAQLSVCMEKDLGLEYPSEIRLTNKFEIGGCEIFICRNLENENIIRRTFQKNMYIIEINNIYIRTIRKERRDHEIKVFIVKKKGT